MKSATAQTLKWSLALLLILLPAVSVAQKGGVGPNPTNNGTQFAVNNSSAGTAVVLKAMAKDKYFDCKALFQSQQYQQALSCFEVAYQLDRDPDLRWNIARCYEEMGNYPLALGRFTAYKDALPADHKDHVLADSKIADVKSKIAAGIAAATPKKTGTLKFTALPPHAKVKVGAKEVNPSSPIEMTPSVYEVVVTDQTGKVLGSGKVSVEAGKESVWEYQPVALLAPPASAPVAAKPTPNPRALSATSDLPTDTGWSTQRWLAIGAGGAAVVSGVLAGVFSSQMSDAENRAVNGDWNFEAQKDWETARNVTVGATSLAVVAAGAAAVLWLTDEPTAPQTTPSVSPAINGVTIRF